MNPVCGSKRRINHAIQVFSIRLGCTFHYENGFKQCLISISHRLIFPPSLFFAYGYQGNIQHGYFQFEYNLIMLKVLFMLLGTNPGTFKTENSIDTIRQTYVQGIFDLQ